MHFYGDILEVTYMMQDFPGEMLQLLSRRLASNYCNGSFLYGLKLCKQVQSFIVSPNTKIRLSGP